MALKEAIRVDGLHFRFRDGREALHDLTLTIDSGEAVGIIGPNGAGKTTLFLTLVGIRQPGEGSLFVAGLDARDKRNLATIRRKAGIVFQDADNQLFSATVRDDVAFGPLNLRLDAVDVQRRVDEALARTGSTPYADRVSHHLSAGEKRRVAIATVLAMEPEIVMLDEPTNDLDPRARRQLIGLINTLPITRLIASHDLEFVRETTRRVIVLDEGRVVADGPTDAILADRQIMEAHALETPPSLL